MEHEQLAPLERLSNCLYRCICDSSCNFVTTSTQNAISTRRNFVPSPSYHPGRCLRLSFLPSSVAREPWMPGLFSLVDVFRQKKASKDSPIHLSPVPPLASPSNKIKTQVKDAMLCNEEKMCRREGKEGHHHPSNAEEDPKRTKNVMETLPFSSISPQVK